MCLWGLKCTWDPRLDAANIGIYVANRMGWHASQASQAVVHARGEQGVGQLDRGLGFRFQGLAFSVIGKGDGNSV